LGCLGGPGRGNWGGKAEKTAGIESRRPQCCFDAVYVERIPRCRAGRLFALRSALYQVMVPDAAEHAPMALFDT